MALCFPGGSHENTFAPSVLHCTLEHLSVRYMYTCHAFGVGILLKNKQFYSKQFPLPKLFQFCSATFLPAICSEKGVTRDGKTVETHGKVRLLKGKELYNSIS